MHHLNLLNWNTQTALLSVLAPNTSLLLLLHLTSPTLLSPYHRAAANTFADCAHSSVGCYDIVTEHDLLSFHSIPHIVLSLLLMPPNVYKFIASVGCTKNLHQYIVRPIHHKTCSLNLSALLIIHGTLFFSHSKTASAMLDRIAAYSLVPLKLFAVKSEFSY
jgi:hypothetical protein